MSAPLERSHAASTALGSSTTIADIDLLLQAHADVFDPVLSARTALADAVDLLVAAFSRGGRIVYVGAGTSGWLAALDAAEVVVTYGVRGRVEFVVAGGATLDSAAMTLGDDDVEQAQANTLLNSLVADDVLLAVSASGATPFTLAAAGIAQERGVRVVALTNAVNSALSQIADVSIDIATAGELVVGSTRLTAGLAQKIALNTLSTAAMVRCGRAVDGLMIAVEPLNDKLRERQLTAVAAAGQSSPAAATLALQEAGGRGDVAVVMLRKSVSATDAAALLTSVHGNVVMALSH